jgi:hypothetical protein
MQQGDDYYNIRNIKSTLGLALLITKENTLFMKIKGMEATHINKAGVRLKLLS